MYSQPPLAILSVEAGPSVHVCPLLHFTAGMASNSLLLPAEEAAAEGRLTTAAGTLQQQCPTAAQQWAAARSTELIGIPAVTFGKGQTCLGRAAFTGSQQFSLAALLLIPCVSNSL